jgi:hypothetical protein
MCINVPDHCYTSMILPRTIINVGASANIQKTFSLFNTFGPFFPGMPAHKLIQAIKCLQVEKPRVQNTQTDVKDIQ